MMRDQITLIKECLRQLNIDEKKFAPRAILSRISHAKEKLVRPEDWHKHFSGFFEDICGQGLSGLSRKLRENNALDFDDLLDGGGRSSKPAPKFSNACKTATATFWWTSIRT